jgi:hypothetical protein
LPSRRYPAHGGVCDQAQAGAPDAPTRCGRGGARLLGDRRLGPQQRQPVPDFLASHQLAYVLGVTSDYTLRPYTADSWADTLPKQGRLAPACHLIAAGACLSDGGAGPGGRPHASQKKPAVRQAQAALILLTVPELRVPLWQLVWHELMPAELVLDWSRWRRRHQATARRCHYKHRTRAG